MQSKLTNKTLELPNQWTPVTDQYVGLDHGTADRLLDERKIRRDLEARHRAERMPGPPFGVAVVTWYYFFRAGAYLLFASMLLTDPLSSSSAWLYGHIQVLVPLAASQIHDNTHGVFVGILVFTSVLSLMIGMLWMMRFAHIRIITLCVLGITLALNLTHLFTGQLAESDILYPNGQKSDLILSSTIEAAFFCYIAISRNVSRTLKDSA